MKGSIFVTRLPGKTPDSSYEFHWVSIYSGAFDVFNELLGEALVEHPKILDLVREMEIIHQINLYELSKDDFKTFIDATRSYIKNLKHATSIQKIAISIWQDQLEELVQKDPRYTTT
jgi:hypothetical protein